MSRRIASFSKVFGAGAHERMGCGRMRFGRARRGHWEQRGGGGESREEKSSETKELQKFTAVLKKKKV